MGASSSDSDSVDSVPDAHADDLFTSEDDWFTSNDGRVNTHASWKKGAAQQHEREKRRITDMPPQDRPHPPLLVQIPPRSQQGLTGNKYQYRADVQLAIACEEERDQKRITYARSHGGRSEHGTLKAVCAYGSMCSREVLAVVKLDKSGREEAYWTVKKDIPHAATCKPKQDNRSLRSKQRQGGTAYSLQHLVPCAIKELMVDPQMKAPSLKNRMNQYVSRTLSTTFVARLRQNALEAMYGNEDDEAANIRVFIEALKLVGHKADIKTASKQEFRVIMLSDMKGKFGWLCGDAFRQLCCDVLTLQCFSMVVLR